MNTAKSLALVRRRTHVRVSADLKRLIVLYNLWPLPLLNLLLEVYSNTLYYLTLSSLARNNRTHRIQTPPQSWNRSRFAWPNPTGKSQIPLRCMVRSWFEAGSNLSATSFEPASNLSATSIYVDSSNLLEVGRRQVRRWSRTCHRPASSC